MKNPDMAKGYQCDLCQTFQTGDPALDIQLSTRNLEIASVLTNSLIKLDACKRCAVKMINGIPAVNNPKILDKL